jgi:hypothetical protein
MVVRRRQPKSGGRFFDLHKPPLCFSLGDKRGYGWPAQDKHQGVIPDDPQLGKKIGFSPKERILVFAGSYGDWASSLSRFAEVHYTDVSPSMTNYARLKFPSNVRSFRARPAELQPRKKGRFDWSFSFEPFPIMDRGTISLVLLRSLLNNKGAKIVFGGIHSRYGIEDLSRDLMKLRRNYRIRTEKRSFWIAAKDSGGRSGFSSFISILTVFTNPHAQRKAQLDLKVLQLLNSADKTGRVITNQEIATRLSVPIQNVKKSRQRLDSITGN